ncbi:MAG: hypothetical protein Q4F57_02405, partial [Weeksellaceae bacterium]|nr:hypothetical protein [Weeksellaceae bacterium]
MKNEIDAVRQSAEKSIGILGRMSNALGEIGVGILKSFAAGNIVSTFTSRISKTTDELLKLSDQMSAVVKTTGLAQKEVKGLWQEFDKFNTRTSKMDLLKISEMGGRLGISDAKELAAFTQEIDKAYVALGDSFSGGLEAVASQLGKIKGLFAETAELSYAEAINKIGSALNELGASGTASEQNMAEFALRIGRLPEALRPAVDVVLGLGAAFEESGVDARIASTGFSDFVSTAATNIDDFAYSMNITVEQAKELINANPEEFFLRFAEGMKGLNAVETAKVLESLKLGSQAVQGAVGAATQNVQLFRDKLILSNQALEEGISMNNEFNEVNNNAAAIWQKIKNVVDEFFTSGEIFNRFEGIIQLMGDFAGVTDDASGRGERLRQLIILLAKTVRTATVVWLAYVAGQKISIIWTTRSMAAIIGETAAKKLSVFWTNSLTAGTHLATAAKMLFTGKVLLARNAMIAFNNSVRLNPLGFLLSLLAAAAVAMGLFGKKAEDASAASDNLSKRQKALNDATKESADIAAKEISKLEQLYKAATNVALSMDQRKEAVKQLKSEYPDYFAQIKDEIIMNGLAENSYISLRNSIMDAARSRALSGKAEEFMSEVLEYENQINEIQKRIGKFVKMHNESTQLEIEIAFQDGTIIGMEDGYGQINELNAKIAETRENYDFFLNQAAKLGQKFIETNRNLGGSTPVGTTQNRASQKTDKIDTGQAAALAAEKEWEQKRLQAQREFWDASHQLDKEGMET